MIKMVMDLLAWKNSLVITEETQVRKKEGDTEKKVAKQAMRGWSELIPKGMKRQR